MAGLARGLAGSRHAWDHPESLLRDAVALSVASVFTATAGTVDLSAYAEARAGISVMSPDGVG